MLVPKLAIIVPCYNEEEIIKTTNEVLNSLIQKLIEKNLIANDSFLFFVDDASTDNSWQIIKTFTEKTNSKAIRFSKNFGHQIAIFAGIKESNADIYITIDADLQDDINAIEDMVKKYLEGSQVVYGVRNNRDTDDFIKKTTAILYYKFIKFLTENDKSSKQIENHADFRLISQPVKEELIKNKDINLYLRGLIPTFGFKSDIVYYSRKKRIGGIGKYNFAKMFNLAIDGIITTSKKPIKIILWIGILSIILLNAICLILIFIRIKFIFTYFVYNNNYYNNYQY